MRGALSRAAEAGHPVLDVGDEALARLLPVVADVDPGLDLRGDDGAVASTTARCQLVGVDVLAPAPAAVELGERPGPGQAPGVGGEDPGLAAQHRRATGAADADELDADPVGVDTASPWTPVPVGPGCSMRRAGPKPESRRAGQDLVDVDVERQQEEPRVPASGGTPPRSASAGGRARRR